MELCRLRGIVRIEAAGQKVRFVDVGQQGPVEAIPCPAGAVVEQDVIGPALLGLPDIAFTDDGKSFDDRDLQRLSDGVDHGVVLLTMKLDNLNRTRCNQLSHMFQAVIDEDADSQDGRGQVLAQGCRLVIADATLLAGKDEAGVIRMKFIGPGNIAGPFEAAKLDLNHENPQPARRAWLSYRDCA